MKLQFHSRGPSIDLKKIEELEEFLGSILPEDYRIFLLNYNGGEGPDRSIFRVETGEKSILQRLFSVQQMPDEITRLRDELSPELIPIGTDIGGNRLCLSLQGETKGQVSFWDHELGKEDAEDIYEPVFFVARSFNEFLAALSAQPAPKVSEIERLGRSGTREEVLQFLAAGNDLEQKNEAGRNIVQEAARYGNLEVLKLCQEEGGPLNGAIHMAAINRCMPAVDYLLSKGVDINERDSQGKTPLALVWDAEFAKLMRLKGAIK